MLAITPLLDKQSQVPIYTQLYIYIREQIECGLLQQGAHLPSIRQLALHLHISKNTIEAAYQQLLAEGYIESKARNGYTILPLEELVRPSLVHGHESSEKLTEADESGIRYDFRYGNMDLERFPHELWKSCLIDSVSEKSNEVLGYGHRLGSSELRTVIAAYIYESRGVVCQPNQIVICAGTQQAISLMCQLLPLQEIQIGIEDPGFNGVKTIFRNHGCSLVPVPLEHDGISIERLYESSAKAVYVTPSHQFPLGMVLPVQKRLKLLQWANEHDGLILEDDYDSEFRYYGQPIPSLKALDSTDRVIYMGTLSKSFLPAARLSYIVWPAELIQTVQKKLELYSQPVSPIIQQAVLNFMKQGHFSRHIRRMKRIYQSKHKTLIQAINRWLGQRVEVIGDKSGLHLLLDVKGRNASELIALAALHGCRVYSPQAHWEDPLLCPPGYIMLGFGGLNEQELEEGIRLLSEAWFPS